MSVANPIIFARFGKYRWVSRCSTHPTCYVRSAREWLMAEGTAAGGPRSAADMINAATAAANSCTVVTADYRDFRGAVNCFNPLSFRG